MVDHQSLMLPFFSISGGALKPTDVEMLWVHVTCAWFRPQVVFQNHEAMEPAMGILKIPPNSFVKVKIWPNGDLVFQTVGFSYNIASNES